MTESLFPLLHCFGVESAHVHRLFPHLDDAVEHAVRVAAAHGEEPPFAILL